MSSRESQTTGRGDWSQALRGWWERRSMVGQLGSADPALRESAIARLIEQPESSPLLYRALYGSIPIACGAAVALERLGQPLGVQTVLTRCYEEEWLLRSVQVDQPGILTALRRIERDSFGKALLDALVSATQQRQIDACLHRLVLASSAIRVLLIFEPRSPHHWWNTALRFGHHHLLGMRGDPFIGLAYNMTDGIRGRALRGLFAEYPDECYETLIEALLIQEHSVGKTALTGLHRLADRRALPYLQNIAFTPAHPLAAQARRAIERIAGAQADALLLLRGALLEEEPEALLRPIAPAPNSSEDANSLLHPLE